MRFIRYSRHLMARILCFLMLCLSLQASAQQTAVYVDPERDYQRGLELLQNQKYGAAQKIFLEVVESKANISEQSRSGAAFFAGKCAAELFNKDAEYLLLHFMETYPASPYADQAVLELGMYYYRLKRYKSAIEWFAKVDMEDLDEAKKDEVNFKMGYSYYQTNDFDKASKAFYQVKDGNSKYATAAQYYYAHMAFVSENYETALKEFLKLKDSEAFGPVAPYYITQIYYRQRKYDEVLNYAPSVLDTAATRNALEIGRMVAEAYYRKEDYKSALPFLMDYEKNSAGAGRVDYYEIAFASYRTGDYPTAVTYFQKVTGTDDSLSQNAYYHMADCFLKQDKKRSARTAFQSAAKSTFNASIQEESAFNYAKLSYELSFQAEALDAFRNFTKNFPGSVYSDQANEMLIAIYTNTRNYKDALIALETIKNKTQSIKNAYQKVAYYRGVELFMDNNSADAITLFNTSIQYPNDQNLLAAANFWAGEASYKLNKYEEAIRYYNTFLLTPAALKSERYNLANYNVGYSYFKMENYSDALTAFRKYVKDKSQTETAHLNDATLRIADCYFMLKDQNSALENYNAAISANSKSTDYAIFQKAVIQGIQSNFEGKVNTLQKLLDKYPKSVYYDDALYEAGQACLDMDKNEEALQYFNRIIAEYPTGNYMKKAEMGQALVYYNTKQDDKALTAYKNIVQKYPNSSESREALIQIKNIAVSQNRVNDYLSYVKNVPNSDVSEAGVDSITYEAAELLYTQTKFDQASTAFGSYIQKFPEGIFIENANYYRADCQYKAKQYNEALKGFEFVIRHSKTNSSVRENSLLRASQINYYLGKYDASLAQFEELEATAEVRENILTAVAGQMRSAFKLNNYKKASAAAQRVLTSGTDNKDAEVEAHFILGKTAFAQSDFGTAKTELSVVAKRTNSEMTAESKYYLALIEFNLNNYKTSSKLIFEIQKQVPSYDYWIAKGFILLGDNYLAQRDTFQAKETYKSIIQNYKKRETDADDLVAIATTKLAAIDIADDKKKEGEMHRLRDTEAPEDSTEIQINK